MVAPNKRPNTLMGAVRHFDQGATRAFVHSIKWPEGPCCPVCGSVNVGYIKSRDRHQCREKGCRKQFSLTTGAIMEATFRFNVRELSEWERFERAMRQIVGKRLTYSDLTGGATR